jgi:serine protease Do
MRAKSQIELTASKRRYTPPVTIRRLVSVTGAVASLVALLTLSPSSDAQSKAKAPPKAAPKIAVPKVPAPDAADVATTVGQAAHQAAEVADQAADAAIQPPAKEDGAPETPLDRARDGVVVLERGGKALGIGAVLAGDGRILTALSPLGHGNNVDARFSDGSVAQVKVGHTDRAWDLALLVPQNGRWKKGLRASRASAVSAGSKLSAFSLVGAKHVAPARTIVKGERTLVGGDNELLKDAIEVVSRFKPTDIGSPVVDEKGDVVALIAKACAPVPDQPCTQVPYGVPVSAIKAFLRTAPANAVPPAPWLGIQGAAYDAGPVKGVKVLSVHPKSPAAAAGMKGGEGADTVVAVDGVPVTSPEALADALNARAVGDSVQLLLFGADKYRQVTLTLRAAPDAGKKAGSAAPPPPRPRKTLNRASPGLSGL